MGKRVAPEVDAHFAAHGHDPKRQRITGSIERNSPRPAASIEVTSARQLQKALVFEQGIATGFRDGLRSFKSFLDSILYSSDVDDLPRKHAMLREYLETQRNGRESREGGFLAAFFQAWDSAVQTNYEALLSQVTAILALLLKVLSSHAQFVEFGTLLCKSVLQSASARRLNRTLSAPPAKETLISPILRLLTEVTRFNEGAHAKAVYAKKDITLEPRILARNIGLWKDSQGNSELEKRKPSIRTNAVRYLLAHLTYQDEIAKVEILSNTTIVRAIFDHLHADPPHIIREILDTLRTHVFLDRTIPRYAKSRILTGKTLSNIARLYQYQVEDDPIKEGQKLPDELAHDFLCMLCTNPAYGVMLPSNGFYPLGGDTDEGDVVVEDVAEQGEEPGFELFDSIQSRGKVRNFVLAEFIQSLRPYANTLHQELIISIFKVCPELIPAYFVQKESFNYDPKVTATWIGYSSFLYQTIELPVPENFGGKRSFQNFPPPSTSVIQCILPQSLTQQVLIKCLNSSSDLVNLFAVRILVIAFRKLQSVLQRYTAASHIKSSKSWEYGSRRLIAEFCQRCPPMKTVILTSRRPAFQKDMMREAITRLLRLYFQITPQIALLEKFDASIPLCNALLQVEKPVEAAEDRVFRVLELEHWIQIARYSPSMRWWQKTSMTKLIFNFAQTLTMAETLPHSPFVTLLKLIATSPEGELYTGIKELLADILRDQEMLQLRTHPDALDALIASLGAPCGASSPAPVVLDFVDDCCARFVKGPIKYLDDLDALQAADGGETILPTNFSPLLMTMVEQWPFKGGKAEKGSPAEPLAQWLSKFLYLLKLIGEEERLLLGVRDSMVVSADAIYQQVLKDAFLWKMGKEKAKDALKLATGADFSGSEKSSSSVPPEHPKELPKAIVAVNLELPPTEDEKHMGLTKWRKKDIEESVEDGDIRELLLCLCSKHTEIRLQASLNIRQLMAGIDNNNNPDHLQLKILLGEVLETAQPIINTSPLPYVAGAFAAHAVKVLLDPTHFLFGKVNGFLMKSPNWVVENLPRYFGRCIINSEPEQDTSYHKEVDWYLDYLMDSLRTAEDMEIFRIRGVFEKLLSYYISASCAVSAREKIVRLLLRAAAVGGSTTLITRCGLVSWIKMRLDNNDHRQRTLRVLASRIWETCDQVRANEWSSGSVGIVIRDIS